MSNLYPNNHQLRLKISLIAEDRPAYLPFSYSGSLISINPLAQVGSPFQISSINYMGATISLGVVPSATAGPVPAKTHRLA